MIYLTTLSLAQDIWCGTMSYELEKMCREAVVAHSEALSSYLRTEAGFGADFWTRKFRIWNTSSNHWISCRNIPVPSKMWHDRTDIILTRRYPTVESFLSRWLGFNPGPGHVFVVEEMALEFLFQVLRFPFKILTSTAPYSLIMLWQKPCNLSWTNLNLQNWPMGVGYNWIDIHLPLTILQTKCLPEAKCSQFVKQIEEVWPEP